MSIDLVKKKLRESVNSGETKRGGYSKSSSIILNKKINKSSNNGGEVRTDSENSSSMTHEDDILDAENDVKPFLVVNKKYPNSIGGLSIPHHGGLPTAFHGYHSHHANFNNNSSKTPFLLPAEIYKSLFASAMLQKQPSTSFCLGNGASPASSSNEVGVTATNSGTFSGIDIEKYSPPPFPKNLLFSCNEKNPQNSDSETGEKNNHKAATFVWANDGTVTSTTLGSIHNNNNNNTNSNNNNNSNSNNSTNNNNNSINNNNNNNQSSTSGTPAPGISPITTISSPSGFVPTNSTMPVGGVQGQNPTQGLVHWMSAVMAEHMTGNTHHDPTVGMHYMWNGSVDVSI